jgi:topoisomerase IA-like protein
MRLENQRSVRSEEDAYTIKIKNANEQAEQHTTTGKSHISPIRLKKLKLDTNEEQRIERTRIRTRNTARRKSDCHQEK